MNEDAARSPFASPAETMGPNRSPQSVVDCASLTNCMFKNAESLKVKLMQRRPIDVLVDQGILPPPKSSPLFYEQKQKLERAKTGDFLKHKIQRRPQRNELIQQHILEDSFDPCYYEEERKLKKARLADDLNERLSQRPGPLELIKGNILHTDESLEQAIKDGQITFKKTCEGEIIKNPPKRFVFEEESSSNDSAPSPNQTLVSSCTLLSPPSAPPAVANYQFNNSFIVTNGSSIISIPQPESAKVNANSSVLTTNLSYIVTTPMTNLLPSSTAPTTFIANDKPKTSCLNVTVTLPSTTVKATTTNLVPKCEPLTIGPSNQVVHSIAATQICQNQKLAKKKVKSKNQPKARIIKFHEYTGPPNVKKQSNSSQADSETSYELLLKQQQMFLQWQLECNQKYPQMRHQNNGDDIMPMPNGEVHSTSCDGAILNEIDGQSFEDETLSSPVPRNALTMNSSFQLNQIKLEDSVPFENSQTAAAIKSAKSTPTIPCLNANNQNGKQVYTPTVKKIISKLEDMKVSDLKAELKKRNLPVSGAKQQLIERLKPFSDSVVSTNNSMATADLNGATIINLGECNNANPELLQSGHNNGNFTSMTSPLPNSTTFILKNNISSDGKNCLNDEQLLFIANNPDNFSTIPLQLKNSSPLTLEAPTLTIPMTNTFIPQYQIVSSTPTDNNNKINLGSINLGASNGSLQTPLGNNILVNKLNILNHNPHHQPSIISTNLNYSNQATNSIGKNASPIILTGEPMQPIQIGPIKNGLSFNLSQQVPSMNSKLVSIQNSGPVFHQLLLYPTTVNAPQDNSTLNNAISTSSKQRSNSFPSESFHQLQRNTSLPLVINQVPVTQAASQLPSKNVSINEKIIDFVNFSPGQPPSSTTGCNKGRASMKKTAKFPITDNLPNSSTEIHTIPFTACVKSTLKSEEKTVTCEFAKGTFTTKTLETVPIISSTIMDYQILGRLPETKESVLESSTKHIQPDSTTSSNSLDLDFILNFDDLHDELAEMADCTVDSKAAGKMALDEPMDFEVKSPLNSNYEDRNGGMIDFNDNWFDIAFSNQSPSQTMQPSEMEESSRLLGTLSEAGTGGDSSFLDSINQIFDQSYPGSLATSRGDEFTFDSYRGDPVLASHNASTSSSANSQSLVGNFPNQPCHFTAATYSGNALKYNLNGANNGFLADSLGDLLFEDSDFKSSLDFPIMLDS